MHLALHLSAQLLAAALVLLTAPLFVDLAVSLLGNLLHPGTSGERERHPIRLAVVIPAHDEEAMIGRTVRSLLAPGCAITEAQQVADVWQVPVFVVAHNCSDATAARAAETGARVLVLNNPQMRGKGAALRFGFEAAHRAGANAFLVMDADSIASANLIEVTRAALTAGAGAVQCRYELERPAGPTTSRARLRRMAFRGINVLRARGRAQLGFSAGIFGNGFALTQATLERVPYTADSICEDLEYHIRLACANVRVEWLDDAVVTAPLSPRGAAQSAQEARWEGGRVQVAFRGTGSLLRSAFRGNWRAIENLAEAWSLPLSRGVAVLALAALLPVHWLHIYAAASAVIATVYVLGAAALGSEPGRDLAALAAAPAHIAWKLLMTPLVMRHTHRRAAWVRTEREAPLP